MCKIYNSVNYDEMKIGEILKDNFVKAKWKVIDKNDNNVTLQNITSHDEDIKISINSQTRGIMFETI